MFFKMSKKIKPIIDKSIMFGLLKIELNKFAHCQNKKTNILK